MNELSPLMRRSDPAGSGGAGCVGGGMRKVVRARTTALEGPASRWPIVTPTAATPTATEPVIRTARRAGGYADSAARGGGPAGTHDAPLSGTSPAPATGTVAPGGGGPAAADGGAAESARSVADAARTSRDMVYAPAAAPSR